MKKLLIGVMLITATGSNSLAQTNFYTTVTNLWYQGYKSNVLELANAKLEANSNDIAGLILKMECKIALLDLPEVSNSILRAIQIGDTITSSNFVKRFQVERNEMLEDLNLFRTYPSAIEEPNERAKAFIKGKELPTFLFDALNEDGYFQ
jgi:hypothetical protein